MCRTILATYQFRYSTRNASKNGVRENERKKKRGRGKERNRWGWPIKTIKAIEGLSMPLGLYPPPWEKNRERREERTDQGTSGGEATGGLLSSVIKPGPAQPVGLETQWPVHEVNSGLKLTRLCSKTGRKLVTRPVQPWPVTPGPNPDETWTERINEKTGKSKVERALIRTEAFIFDLSFVLLPLFGSSSRTCDQAVVAVRATVMAAIATARMKELYPSSSSGSSFKWVIDWFFFFLCFRRP